MIGNQRKVPDRKRLGDVALFDIIRQILKLGPALHGNVEPLLGICLNQLHNTIVMPLNVLQKHSICCQ